MGISIKFSKFCTRAMRTQRFREADLARFGALCLSLAAIGLLTACASTGRGRTESTTSQMKALRAEVQGALGNVDSTLAALNKVVASTDADLRKPYKEFVGQVEKLAARAQQTRARREKLQAQVRLYFAEWEKQLDSIESEELRRASQERKIAVSKRFDALGEHVKATRATYEPFAKDLKDIRAYLDLDLTAVSVKQAGKSVTTANADGQALKEKLRTLVKEMDAFVAEVSAVAPRQ